MSLPRKIVEFTHRERLEDSDIRFVAQAVGGKSPKEQAAVMELLVDSRYAQSRDQILDSESLSDALGVEEVVLPVTMELFLYVNARPFLKSNGVTDPSVAAFVAASFAQAPRSQTQVEVSPQVDSRLTQKQRWNLFKSRRPYAYMADLNRQLRGKTGHRRFEAILAFATEALFISGFCADKVAERQNYRGSPPREYYASFAAANFAMASNTPEACQLRLSHTLGLLGDHTPEVCSGLAAMRAEVANW